MAGKGLDLTQALTGFQPTGDYALPHRRRILVQLAQRGQITDQLTVASLQCYRLAADPVEVVADFEGVDLRRSVAVMLRITNPN